MCNTEELGEGVEAPIPTLAFPGAPRAVYSPD
jgi:hypothetical protein